jgi:hypothetical protein
MQAPNQINNCLEHLAISEDNISICDLIKDDDYAQKCYGRLIKHADLNVDLCNKLKDPGQGNCFNRQAIRGENLTLCYRITGQNKYPCLKKVAGITYDWTFCNGNITQDIKEICTWNKAIAKMNASSCEAINDEKIKEFCYSDLAFVINASETCSNISDDIEKSWCFRNFAV